jgi:hypothetical protein
VTSSPCLDGLLERPVPVYSDALDVAVLWSAKAGCTFAIKWIWYHEGRLDEAAAFHPWPHLYRQRVYYRRPGYHEQLRRIPSLGPRCVKFVRDPYRRAVSAYLHVSELATNTESPRLRPFLRDSLTRLGRLGRQPAGIRQALHSWFLEARLLDRQRRPPLLRDLSSYLERPVGPGHAFTFREFVSYLGSVDLDVANTHFRRQSTPYERAGCVPDITVLRIEESRERLPLIEDALGLGRSDHDLLLQSAHHTRRQTGDRFVGDDAFGSGRAMPVPDADAFYDAALRSAVTQLYAEDFDRYGYPRREG